MFFKLPKGSFIGKELSSDAKYVFKVIVFSNENYLFIIIIITLLLI